MVSLALHEPSQEIAYTGESFVARLQLEKRNEQEFSWTAQVGRTHGRLSQMQLDSRGFSWVSYLQAEAEQQQKPIMLATERVLNEKHREKVGAEAPQPDTPKLMPLFSKNPAKGKFSLAHLREKAEKSEKPKSVFAWLN